MQLKPRKILVRTAKWLLGIFVTLLLLLLLVWGVLQTRWGQNKLRQIGERYLQGKLKSRVTIGSVSIKWFSHIEIKDVYLEDLRKRPLLAVKRLDVEYDLSGIFDKRLSIPAIELEGTRVALYRSAIETRFNYNFILEAFSGTSTTLPDTTAKAFEIKPGKISIHQFSFLMDDQYGGQVIDVSLGNLLTDVDGFDLEQMQFHTKYLSTDSLRGIFGVTKKSGPSGKPGTTDTTTSPFRFGTDTVLLAHSNIRFSHEPDQFKLATAVGDLGGSALQFDLAQMHASARYIKLLDHTSSISMVSVPGAKEVAEPPTGVATKPFTFAVGKIDIDRNELQFDDNGQPKAAAASIDPAHLGIQGLRLQAEAVEYNGAVYAANILQFSLTEKSGFQLQAFNAKARYSDTGLALQGLVLRTPQNQFSGDAQMSYASLAEITSKPGSTRINLDLKKSRIQLDELLYFSPGLKQNKSFQPLLGKVFYINTRVDGQLNKLHIPELVMTQDRTRLLASADVYELPDIKKMRIDLRLKEFSGNRKDLLGFLPKNTIPDSLLHYIPESFRLTGSYRGTLNDLFADLKLTTTSGNVAVKGTLKNVSDPRQLIYDLDLQTEEIRLGELLQDSSLGNITARVKAKGKGTDIKTADADIQASVQKAQYGGYTYSEIDLDAKLHNNTIDANIDSRDPNLNLRSKTFYNMDKAHGSFTTATTIDRVDLFKLGLFKDTLTLSGKVDANIPQLDTAQVNGTALVSAVEMDYGGKQYRLDSVALSAVYANDTQSMEIHSPFADATLIGKYTLSSIPAAAKTIANRYLYTRTDKDTSFTRPMAAKLEANVHIADSLLGLLPGVKVLSPFSLTARIDTDSSILAFLTRINKLHYGDILFDSITLGGLYMPSRDSFQTMKYLAQVEHVTTPSFILEKSMVLGTIHHGVIEGKIELDGDDEKPRYIIPYTFTNNPGMPELKIGDSLLINRQGWAVNKDNIIYLNTDALKGSNLVISNKGESISILADSANNSGLPLTIRLDEFRLKNVSDIFVSDTSLVEGTVNGNVSVLSFAPFQFTSTLKVDSLKLKEINAGTLVVDVREEVPNEMLIDLSLKGSSNDVVLKGKYQAKESEADLHLNMASFDLQNIAPFVTKYLGKLEGRIQGDITAKGNISGPQIRGNLRTDSVDLVYKDFGTAVMIPSGELLFTEEGLRFNQFEFLDSAGHKGRIEGGVGMKSLGEYQIDTKITTNRFLVIDRKRQPDQMIFGPTWADAQITLKGNQDLVNIEGNVKVIDSSKLTYINSSTGASGRGEGLIEFFDPSHPLDTLLKAQKKTLAAGPKFAVNTYINVTPTTKVTIVLDEYSGDQLVVQGTAALNFSMSAGGAINLTGNYEVEKGDYDLSLAQLLKRKFSIVKGSRITWNGDPLKAEMNITALYKVRTTAGELVNDIQNVPGIDKQKLNFEVYLILTKEMLKPDINFRLDMPENERDAFDSRVYNRIRQVNSIPSDLNKQVMGLLALNHFISDNPFSSLSTTGSSMETTVYNTAGKMLTQELTDLVGGAVKGVDIDFNLDINDDYTSSGTVERTTDLKMGVRKSLADNRLQVYVGSTFALEGHNQNENSVAGIAGDITLEYMLTKDGRYRIKGFRINEEDMTFEGTIVKTGVTFVVVLEFNKIKNAFKKKKNREN
ncbi:translocation/assembly module TamB domain-containing protein [Flavihumibacter fluvii]|uniref:translocation/assembly module TamB domain-containing protein n=1 Tax=Flavihumibacter fluvii TaxID=2838157 RepID=UPI001BDE5031|nr:translocation/assembly module TamB domain-containing protein [Flavihumibacter fluvii]ULQ53340.1 translocation/assembly module TamB [Flavihumibacter fluvii]